MNEILFNDGSFSPDAIMQSVNYMADVYFRNLGLLDKPPSYAGISVDHIINHSLNCRIHSLEAEFDASLRSFRGLLLFFGLTTTFLVRLLQDVDWS